MALLNCVDGRDKRNKQTNKSVSNKCYKEGIEELG